MSLISMTRLASNEKAEAAGPSAAISKTKRLTLGSALESVVAFIPTEVVTLYVAALGIFHPTTSAAKWGIFGFCGLLVPIFVIIGSLEEHQRGKEVSIKSGGLVVVFGLVAYTTWTMALPETPFEEFTEYATKIGGAAVLVTASILPRVAGLCGVNARNPTK